MAIQQLADYIKRNLRKGYTLDSLRFSLISQGYTKISVENAIQLANKQMAQEIPAIKEKPTITYRAIEEKPPITQEEPIIIEEEPDMQEEATESKKGFLERIFGR